MGTAIRYYKREVALAVSGAAGLEVFRMKALEKRIYPRYPLNLPIECYRINSNLSHAGRAANASEGGLLVYLPEKLDIGKYSRVKIFFAPGTGLDPIETLVQTVWIENHWDKFVEYRSGMKLIGISPKDMERLRSFLNGQTD